MEFSKWGNPPNFMVLDGNVSNLGSGPPCTVFFPCLIAPLAIFLERHAQTSDFCWCPQFSCKTQNLINNWSTNSETNHGTRMGYDVKRKTSETCGFFLQLLAVGGSEWIDLALRLDDWMIGWLDNWAENHSYLIQHTQNQLNLKIPVKIFFRFCSFSLLTSGFSSASHNKSFARARDDIWTSPRNPPPRLHCCPPGNRWHSGHSPQPAMAICWELTIWWQTVVVNS